MVVKSVGVGIAGIGAAAAIAAVGAGMVPVTSGVPQVQPVVFGVPMPLEPASGVPSNGELLTILNGLSDPGVPFANKGGFVEGGISASEATIADRKMQQEGNPVINWTIGSVTPSGPGEAIANITATNPDSPPVSFNAKFVNSGDGWKITHRSGLNLLSAL